MLSVIVIWSYMFLTTFLIGWGILCAARWCEPYRVGHMDSYLVCGLAGVTVYAQLYSLFGGVGLTAHLILCAVCLAIAWVCRRGLFVMLRDAWQQMRENRFGERGKVFGILFLFLLFAYGTSRGIIHYDTSLYHAQSIRWIETYGAVKGLGNLHCRLAYNSSSFALSALYSMAFLGGQSYHCAAGFFAWILAKVCMEILASLRRGRLRISDFARVMGIYYLVTIFDEMVSPASDYFMVLLAFYIVIRWLELAERGTGEVFPYALLCVLGVFLMTVKLSAALILLLTVYPAYHLLRGHRWRETAVYLGLGMLTALPYFIRNFLLSGWLVYPFTQIDLFDVAWKIPKGMADYDAREIQVWGRGYTDVTRYGISMREWMPDWFATLAGSDRLLVAAAVASLIVLLVYGVGMLCGFWQRRWNVLLVQVTVAGSFLFWLCTSPLIRYGCVYVYLTPAVVIGGVYDAIVNGGGWRGADVREKDAYRSADMTGNAADTSAAALTGGSTEWHYAAEPGYRKLLRLCGMAAAVFVLVYKCAALGREIIGSYQNDYWVLQKDYENYATESYEIDGVTFYYPVSGDQVGYDAFPSAPYQTDVRFLGEGIGEGFMADERTAGK
ncbi:MAG: hypothetical protein NC489_26720 [Ruminococcus flavefaciens]|nr:hypothetical protein [Ruminococcus flavefaciens]